MAAGAEITAEAAVAAPPAVESSPKTTETDVEIPNAKSMANGVKETKDHSDSKSEMQMRHIVDMLSSLKLNPLAKEFFPASHANDRRDQFAADYFLEPNKELGLDGFPNNRKRRNNFNQGRKRLNGRAFRAQREDSIRRTVYVSDIDHNVTEERLAALFSGYGQSEDEREMCVRTVYCTNIDKKVLQADVKIFFETRCGEASRPRLLGDQIHSTRIAFVEFVTAESAIMALDCCGMVLGSQPIRVSPSKTPVRPRVTRSGMQ